MSDITKCNDSKCINCEYCHRFTTKASQYQSYFCESPLQKDYCREFWPMRDYTTEFTLTNDAMFIHNKNGYAKIFPAIGEHVCVVNVGGLIFDKISSDVKTLVDYAEFLLF